MIKVPYGQDPYSVIGKYIRDHIPAIEDIIAVIEIDDITTNQLFMVDMNEENYFIWENDWYEGEKDIALIDFFPVSEAINPSAQPEIIRCRNCKHWRQQTNYQGAPLSFGFCESDDMWRSLYGETYEVSHIDTDDDFYCGYAERRTDGRD